MAEAEMARQYHRLHGHEFGQIPGPGEGQGSLAGCSPWGGKESDTTEVTEQHGGVGPSYFIQI